MQSRAARAWPYLALAVLGVLLQARAESPGAYLGPLDAARNLALAQSLPDYALYDQRTYLIHPPLHAVAVRGVAALGAGLPLAGVLVSSLGTIGLALVLFAVARRVLRSTPGALIAACGVLFSRGATLLGQGVWREPLQVLLLCSLFAILFGAHARSRNDSEDAPSPGALTAVVAVSACMALTWDVFVLLAPLLVAAGALWRRRLLLVSGVVLIAVWGCWAGVRYSKLTAEPTYPAGIDGRVEDTADVGPGAVFNPNFLPRTAAHNAYFWPWSPTPLRPFELAAPWFSHPDGQGVATVFASRSLTHWTLLVVAACVCGAVLFVRRPPTAWRLLLLFAACSALLASPGALGKQARYAHALTPLAWLLVGRCASGLLASLRTPPRRARHVLAIGVGVATLGWYATRPHATWTRPLYMEARSVRETLEAIGAQPKTICAPLGLAAEMTYLFPRRRVVTLPGEGDLVRPLLESRSVELIVMPHEVGHFRRPGSSVAEMESAHGLGGIREVYRAANAGELRHLGSVVEAERSDRVRLRVFDLFARGDSTRAFGIYVPPSELAGVRAALSERALSRQSLQVLNDGRSALEALVDDPQSGPEARAVLALLDGYR